jgi:hypothetical protein
MQKREKNRIEESKNRIEESKNRIEENIVDLCE